MTRLIGSPNWASNDHFKRSRILGSRVVYCWFFALSLAAGLAPVAAQEAILPASPEVEAAFDHASLPRNSLAVFVGVYTTSYWARSFSINTVGYEPNYVIAIVSSKDLIATPWGLRIGHESGIAIRFGSGFSVEIWRGFTVSFSAELVGGTVVTPRLVLGLSSVSNPIGIEVEREAEAENGDVARLVYLGSELARSLTSLPFVEIFYRLHHRSGAIGFWGNVAAGHNANGVGIRIWY